MSMPYSVEDLGTVMQGDVWLFRNDRIVRHPRTGDEFAVLTCNMGGFVLLDPRTLAWRQIVPEVIMASGWAIDQAPDGTIYQSDSAGGHLYAWRWEDEISRVVATFPKEWPWFVDMSVAADGRVFLLDGSGRRPLYHFDARTGKIGIVGGERGHVLCSQEGTIYAMRDGAIIVLDPDTGQSRPVLDESGAPCRGALLMDGGARVVVGFLRLGRPHFRLLRGDRAVAIDSDAVRFCRTAIGTNAIDQEICGLESFHGLKPLVFADGSYIASILGPEVTVAQADGSARSVRITLKGQPLGIWCTAAGGGRIWGGTVIPIALFSYDPLTNHFERYDENPTETKGEIYSMVFSKDKLYMASYIHATLTRFTPDRPWKLDRTASANPACLGFMKDGPDLFLQRPHGRAADPAGNVYFSSVGGYGCLDSGLCRIDPDTDEAQRWIYPETNMEAICYIPPLDQVLVSESRHGEDAIRFTFVCPCTGRRMKDDVVIRDKGCVRSWLWDGADRVYGVHDYRATVFVYSLSEGRIVARTPELTFGDHRFNALQFGPDGRVWGLTNRCVFGVERDLSASASVAEFEPDSQGGYRFGFDYGADGNLYFARETHLMRLRIHGP
jgi:sugar lactone lactonase YvrE